MYFYNILLVSSTRLVADEAFIFCGLGKDEAHGAIIQSQE